MTKIEPTLKLKVIIPVVAVVIVAAVVAGFFIFGRSDEDTSNVNSTVTETEYGKIRRFLDGVLVKKGDENNKPRAIMIENLVSVRPQSSLSKASVVYEVLVEGGITRFMAIYDGSEKLESIGPVRSARAYFLDWAEEYKPLYVHCGGSPDALASISEYNLYSLNQIGGDHAFFWRDQDRSAPHNLYTSGRLLAFAFRDKDLDQDGDFDPWLFKEEAGITDRTTEEKYIKIDFSSFSYQVEYRYQREDNDYLRLNGEKEHKDALTDEQIRAKNIVIQLVDTELSDTQTGRLQVQTIGGGRAIIFQDGQALEGTWEKSSREERTRFYDSDNKEVKLNAGPIWIEVVPLSRENAIEYN